MSIYIKIIIFFYILAPITALRAQSHFDNIKWVKTKTDRGISVYTINDGDCNYIKAEITYPHRSNMTAKDFFEALINYDEYMKIFEKVKRFQQVGTTEKGEIISALVNFSPLKNRVYYIVLWTTYSDNTYIIEWQPYTGDNVSRKVEKNEKYVSKIYGRWILKDNPDGSIYISNELHNNWEYSGLSMILTTPGEEDVSVKNILLLYRYVAKKTKS